jgi:hypothetical protein
MQPSDPVTAPDHPPTTPAEIDDIILHTDSGAGTSQREHWPPNVDKPAND